MRFNISRRGFIGIGAGAIVAAAAGEMSAQYGKEKELLIFVGTYTSGTKSEGIYTYAFDAATGKLTQRAVTKNVADPSFLAIDPDRKVLIAANELLEYEGKKSGAVSSFAINRKTGTLDFLSKQSSAGGAPCFATTSRNGKFALVANYLGGNAVSLPIDKDGKLGAVADAVQHSGSGPNKDRQEAPHTHSVNLDHRGKFAFVADLGIDRLMIYAFDQSTGKFKPNEAQPYFQTKAGAGPRHFTFHPNGKLAFLINELDFTLTSLAYDEDRGKLSEIATVPTLPAGASRAGVTCADVHVSPDGRFVYGSNRGHGSIVAFGVDQKSGALTLVGHVPCGGTKPRNFAISPDGKFLLVANQDTDSIVVFARDEKTGALTPTENRAEVPAPVCMKFL